MGTTALAFQMTLEADSGESQRLASLVLKFARDNFQHLQVVPVFHQRDDGSTVGELRPVDHSLSFVHWLIKLNDLVILKRLGINLSLHELPLSARTRRILRSQNVRTVSDLVKLGKRDTECLRQVGKTRITEIHNAMNAMGINWS
jgi:hypothetical protein